MVLSAPPPNSKKGNSKPLVQSGGGDKQGALPPVADNATAQASSSPVANEPESMRKLRALKEKIQREYQLEQKERLDNETKEVIVPLSLAADYGSNAKKGTKAHQASRQQVEKLVTLTKEKISGLKQLDKYMQRELEVELEKKAVETMQLKSQNQRLREIVTLRQESNARREHKFEAEVAKVKDLTDETCIDTRNYHVMMQQLRDMNRQVQEGAVQMKATIDEQAEAERLALIRTYRVRMREVKQQLKLQEAANLDGASAWIRRYNVLDTDREAAEANLKSLQQKIELLTTDNSELKVMRKHQEEQRNSLAQKIASLKRENKRFEEHIQRIEEQLAANAQQQQQQGQGESPNPVRLLQSRGSTRRMRPPIMDPVDKKQAEALESIRKMLDEMRQSLRNVRSAHVELLQERSELEMFLRQCIEDVRRDMYRFTVVSNITRTQNTSGDRYEEKSLLEDYGVKERKRLLDILNSKLVVFSLLHSKMFPGKAISGDEPLGEYLKKQQQDWEQGSTASEKLSSASSRPVVPVVHEMDQLWNRWKEWTRSVTPT